MPEESPLVRQWILLRTLCSRRYGMTIHEIAEEVGVSEKTIRRDLQVFLQSGFPLEETVEDFGRKRWHLNATKNPAAPRRAAPCRARRKRWHLNATKNQPGMTFAFDEAIALYLGRHLMEPLAGTLFWEAAQRAFKKIRASLGTDALKYVEKFSGMFHQTMVGVSDYSKKADLIDVLMVGIEDRRAVFITYQSARATEPVTYDIYPYGLTYHRGSLYLVGWAPDHEEIRHWKVDRIDKAELTPIHFQQPDDFDLHTHLAKSFGVFHGDGAVHIKIRFSPTVARYVQEGTWHPSQKLTPKQDGSLLADFDLDTTEEIKRWILSFGRHAVVLEPEGLRGDLHRELEIMMGKYVHKKVV